LTKYYLKNIIISINMELGIFEAIRDNNLELVRTFPNVNIAHPDNYNAEKSYSIRKHGNVILNHEWRAESF